MAFDKDWIKVMGDNFVPLNAEQIVAEDGGATTVVEATGEEEVAPETEVQPVEEETPTPDGITPTAEEQATEKTGEDTTMEEEQPSGEDVPPSEEDKQAALDAEAQQLIDELLGEVEKSTVEKKEEADKLEEAVEKTGDEDLKKQLEEYRLKEEQLESKVAAVTSEYRKLLDKTNTLEAINDEYTAKMRIISDNPLLQDLLRGLYLQGENPTSITNLESTLKQMLKEYAQIDVDDLAAKTRDAGAESLSPSDTGAVVGENTVYKGLLEEGDIVPLNGGE